MLIVNIRNIKFYFSVIALGVPVFDHQTISVVSALTCTTFTVVQAAHDDLVRMGYPMVVVDRWDEVTPEKVEEWWAALSPLLEDVRPLLRVRIC